MRETHTLETRYFERMAKSLGDKMKIVEQLPRVTENYSPRVLDVGAGGGEFSDALQQLGYDVVALDASDDAIMRMREKFPELTTALMLANESIQLGEESFDAIVCSSILHEVYSYGDSAHGKGQIESLDGALDSFFSILKPGGVLVIRDGVKPENWDAPARVRTVDGSGIKPIITYLSMCPFSNHWIPGDTGSLVKLVSRDVKEGWFEGNLQSAYEFYMTYNWGMDSYPRETQELYGVLTLDEYIEKLQERGFFVSLAESWVQPGYSEYLPKKVELETEDGVNRWPATNALWVARKY